MTTWDDAANPIAKLHDTMRIGGTGRPEPRRVPTNADLAETIEASCRIRMATITQDRGFDTRRERDNDIAAIDALLDRWLELTCQS